MQRNRTGQAGYGTCAGAMTASRVLASSVEMAVEPESTRSPHDCLEYSTMNAYMSAQFNDADTSDVEVCVRLYAPAGEQYTTYRLHKIIISQCMFFRRMMFGRPGPDSVSNWIETSNGSKVVVCLHDNEYATADVVDVFMRMLYSVDYAGMEGDIRARCIQIYHLSDSMGFDRGLVHCEKIICDGIDLSNMMEIFNYCVATGRYDCAIYRVVIQWVKVFLFHLGMCSTEQVLRMDMNSVKEILRLPDVMCHSDSKRGLLDMYEKGHGSDFEPSDRGHAARARRREMSALKRAYPCIEEELLLLNGQTDPRKHRTMYVLRLCHNWKQSPNRRQKDDADPVSVFPLEDRFHMCECSWKTYAMHNHHTNETIISIAANYDGTHGSSPGRRQNSNPAKRVCVSLRVTVHIVHRTGTQTTHHVGAIQSDYLRLDLKNSIDGASMDDCFTIENDSDANTGSEASALHLVGFVVEMEVTDRKDIFLSRTVGSERERRRTC